MANETITPTGIAAHGASRLPSVEVDSFNIELKDEEGFLGDRASKGAFRDGFDLREGHGIKRMIVKTDCMSPFKPLSPKE